MREESADMDLAIGRFIGLALVVGGLVLVAGGAGLLPHPALHFRRGLTTGCLFIAVGVGQVLKPDLLWSTSEEQEGWFRFGAALGLAALLGWWLLGPD